MNKISIYYPLPCSYKKFVHLIFNISIAIAQCINIAIEESVARFGHPRRDLVFPYRVRSLPNLSELIRSDDNGRCISALSGRLLFVLSSHLATGGDIWASIRSPIPRAGCGLIISGGLVHRWQSARSQFTIQDGRTFLYNA